MEAEEIMEDSSKDLSAPTNHDPITCIPRTDHVEPAGTMKSSKARAPLEVSKKRVEGIPEILESE